MKSHKRFIFIGLLIMGAMCITVSCLKIIDLRQTVQAFSVENYILGDSVSNLELHLHQKEYENSKLLKQIESLKLNINNLKQLEEVGDVVDNEVVEENTVKHFEATAYCGCKKCNGKWVGYPTASGTDMVQGRTIAVDPTVIPLGSAVIVDGHTYIAEDTGSAIKGNIIDIYFDSHEEALKFGRQNVEVKIIN